MGYAISDKSKKKNQSPKGNMSSAIPVALLYMIMNLSEGNGLLFVRPVKVDYALKKTD